MLAFGIGIFKYGFILDLYLIRFSVAYTTYADPSISISVGVLWLNFSIMLDTKGSGLPRLYKLMQEQE